MNETAQLSEILSGYLDHLDHRLSAVDGLRRQAGELGAHESGEVLPLLEAVDDTVRRSGDSARVLLRWLQAGSN